jgi:retron-type reverse transcriptase
MRTAATVLNIIQERGKRKLPVEDIYRQLYNPSLYLRAYAKLYPNNGAMTQGSTSETVDAMTMTKINKIIDDLRHERYRWTPVRRIYIPKKQKGKYRPLGLPSWSDKLLQEVIRHLLEAYYDCQFSDHSHGFRPGRGCHTALSTIKQTWNGTRWFLEGDIKACFDQIDHGVLLSILGERSSMITASCVWSDICFRLDTWRIGTTTRLSVEAHRAVWFHQYSAISTWTSWIPL